MVGSYRSSRTSKPSVIHNVSNPKAVHKSRAERFASGTRDRDWERTKRLVDKLEKTEASMGECKKRGRSGPKTAAAASRQIREALASPSGAPAAVRDSQQAAVKLVVKLQNLTLQSKRDV